MKQSRMFRAVFWVILPCEMIVDISHGSITQKDSSEHHTRRRENLKSQTIKKFSIRTHLALLF
jgi:hypothetical protein